jgi:hypothetical protein
MESGFIFQQISMLLMPLSIDKYSHRFFLLKSYPDTITIGNVKYVYRLQRQDDKINRLLILGGFFTWQNILS